MTQRQDRRVTLKDVALKCGCTANTVSRALRGDERLPERTRSMICAAAKEMGYIRNLSAHTLRSGSSHTVAAIINDVNNPYYTNMVSDIDRHLSLAGYHMIILSCRENEETAEKMIMQAISMSVDGILFFPFSSAEHIHLLQRSGIPFVILDRRVPGTVCNSVRLDDESGGYESARNLLERGHRRILYLAGPYTNSSQADRQRGILRAFRAFGVPEDQLRILPWDKRPHDGSDGFALLEPIDYTAIIAFSDDIAYHCMNDLRSHGVRVPQDLSVSGFDHIRRCNSAFPPLTSVTARDQCVAEVAVQVLLEHMSHSQAEIQSVILPITLSDDETVAAPAR